MSKGIILRMPEFAGLRTQELLRQLFAEIQFGVEFSVTAIPRAKSTSTALIQSGSVPNQESILLDDWLKPEHIWQPNTGHYLNPYPKSYYTLDLAVIEDLKSSVSIFYFVVPADFGSESNQFHYDYYVELSLEDFNSAIKPSWV